MRTEANQKTVALRRELFGTRIKVNPDAFHIAARNLTENAMQYAQGENAVRWSLVPSGSEMLLTIDDDGPGIPSDELDLVTKRFFRGRHKSAIGSGLGLSIVETALRKDGLSMRLESRAPEGGLRAQIVIAAGRVTVPEAETQFSAHPGLGEPARS